MTETPVAIDAVDGGLDEPDDLPRFHELLGPALAALAEADKPQRTWEVVATVADRQGLSGNQRKQAIPSGQRRFDNRLNWALSYLFQAQVVSKPSRGVYEITDRGRELLAQHPDGFAVETLRQYEEFLAFQARSRNRNGARHLEPGPAEDDRTPLEQVSAAVEQLDTDVAAELVQRIHTAPPVFLEKAVLRLLVAMGYGGSHADALHLGGPGDGGFDGVINQDQLGIGRVYVQAKRYAPENSVGRPEVQGFVGALHHAGAAGGVMITTSRFSAEAIEFARTITPRVILIDGARLGRLMVTHGIGVQERQVFRVVETDEDFFDQA
ncbi:MAG: restriction endonuclease [Ornithinimicrobium sp.]